MRMNTLIPMSGQTVNMADSLMSGAKLADLIMGRGNDKGLTEYQREMLALKRAELQREPSLTPYQARSLDLREREIADRRAARDAPTPVSAVEGIRRKLVSGEPLSPGEQRVYDDAMNVSAFDRFLLGQQTTNAPPPMGVRAQTPPVPVNSVEEAKRLPSGTRFVAPDGTIRVVP